MDELVKIHKKYSENESVFASTNHVFLNVRFSVMKLA